MQRPNEKLKQRYTKISIHAPYKGCNSYNAEPIVSCNISIHAPYKGCNIGYCHVDFKIRISIHAPYKGCNPLCKYSILSNFISIHAPYKGCNRDQYPRHIFVGIFQSMHPIKDATRSALSQQKDQQGFQSMHPIKDATPFRIWGVDFEIISIHAPYKGCNFALRQRSKINS